MKTQAAPQSKTLQETVEGVAIYFERESGKFFIEQERPQSERWRGLIIRRFGSLAAARLAARTRVVPGAAISAFDARLGWRNEGGYQKVEIASYKKRGYQVNFYDRQGEEVQGYDFREWDPVIISDLQRCDEKVSFWRNEREEVLKRAKRVTEESLTAAQAAAKGAT